MGLTHQAMIPTIAVLDISTIGNLIRYEALTSLLRAQAKVQRDSCIAQEMETFFIEAAN